MKHQECMAEATSHSLQMIGDREAAKLLYIVYQTTASHFALLTSRGSQQYRALIVPEFTQQISDVFRVFLHPIFVA